MSTNSDDPPAKRQKPSSELRKPSVIDSIQAIPALLYAFQNAISLYGYRGVPKINASNLTMSVICSQNRMLVLNSASITSFLVGKLLSGTQKPHRLAKSILSRHPLNRTLSGSCVDTLIGHRDNVNTCCPSPSNQVLITCSNDSLVKIWESSPQKNEHGDCVSSTCVASLKHSSRVRSLAIHPTQPLMVTGDDRGEVKVFWLSPDHKSATLFATLEGHTGLILSTMFHPTARIIVTTSSDGTSRLWHFSPDLKTFDCLLVLYEPTGWVQSAVFHPTMSVLVTCNEDKTIKFWMLSSDFKSAKCTSILEGHTGPILSLRFSEDWTLLATASEDGTAKIWRLSPDYASAFCVATLKGHKGPVSGVAFSPFGSTILATSSYDRTVKLWLLLAGSSSAIQVATLEGHLSCVLSVIFRQTQLITTSSDRTAITWE